ncbi:MAG: GntR family transcriptional regulator [Paenibacillus sp.]|nr:GntR family transcriptional regulator [Paenibacillus sp.]
MDKTGQGRKSPRTKLNELVGMLRQEIKSGRRAAGEFLPSEKWLAEQYNLSNQSVRKGLELLLDEGLIEKIPRVGSKVLGLSDDSKVTVKLGFHTSITSEAQIDEILVRFHECHPAIHVQPVPLPYSMFGHLKQYFNGQILDAVMVNYTDFQEFTESGDAGLLEPTERNSEIYPFLSDAFVKDGEQLAQPFIFSPLILCYNRQHFLERHLPEPDSSWRWKDLIEYAGKLAIPNERIGFHCDLYSPNRWPLLPLQAGVQVERSEEGGIQLTNTQMMESLRVCRDISRQLPLLSEAITVGQSEQLLAKGKVSMIMTSYFYLNYFNGEDVPFDIAPVPHNGTPTSMLLNIGLAVNSQSSVKDAAVQLVEFLTSYETQLVIRQQTYSLPAVKQAAEWQGAETMYRPSRFSLFRETIPGFRYFTELGLRASELRTINREVKLYWAGLESEESFCSRMDEYWRSMPAPIY